MQFSVLLDASRHRTKIALDHFVQGFMQQGAVCLSMSFCGDVSLESLRTAMKLPDE